MIARSARLINRSDREIGLRRMMSLRSILTVRILILLPSAVPGPGK